MVNSKGSVFFSDTVPSKCSAFKVPKQQILPLQLFCFKLSRNS